MIDVLYKIGSKAFSFLHQGQLRREHESQIFASVNERPVEYEFVFRQLTRQWPSSVLDVGSGLTALPHLMRNCGFVVTAIDNVKDYWPKWIYNRHYLVIDDDITKTNLRSHFDFITCVSVLEHIPNSRAAVRSMLALLKPLGFLVITFPFTEKNYVRNVYDLPDSTSGKGFPFITQSYSRSEIDLWTAENQARVVEQEYWEFYEGDYWTCGKRINPPRKVSSVDRHQHSCLLLQKI
jgi:SAM-dependent methyltransferase